MGNALFATKSLDVLMREAGDTSEHSLKRCARPVNLVTLESAPSSAREFSVLTGSAAALYAGPAIILSYVLAGTACVFAGLCYAGICFDDSDCGLGFIPTAIRRSARSLPGSSGWD